ncbi:conjugal transfer protein TrbD (plasmid) [Bartonella heixiaziensis]|uniref:conjugal transfer protein TrbD n=1 Tax=Bartonella heixiaziensis TaxID=1461000 RepID=UPI003F4F2DDE
MGGKRYTQLFRSLHRPQQIMGGERELMLFSMLLTGILIVSAMNIVAATIGLCIWVVCLYVLRRMAKFDPILSRIYIRQLRYRGYYAPFSRPFRVAKSTRPY